MSGAANIWWMKWPNARNATLRAMHQAIFMRTRGYKVPPIRIMPMRPIPNWADPKKQRTRGGINLDRNLPTFQSVLWKVWNRNPTGWKGWRMCASSMLFRNLRKKEKVSRSDLSTKEYAPTSNKNFISPRSPSHLSFARRRPRSDQDSLLSLCSRCPTASPVLASGGNPPTEKMGTDPVGPKYKTG